MLIGRTIRKNDFVAAVLRGDECYSACALAWLGSRHRVMQRGAIVGFHGAYKIDYGQSVITAPGNAVIGAYLAELGFSVNAIIFMTEASPGKVAYLDPLSAERYSIEVAVISSDYKSTELYGQRRVAAAQPEAVTPAQPAIDANVAAREAAELPNIANACHTVVDPRTYDYSNCYRQETESLHWAVTSQEAYPKEKRHSCWKESKSYPIMRWKHYKLCVAGK